MHAHPAAAPRRRQRGEQAAPDATARERAAEHRVRPECATCHELFDPIGFAFENFDAVGRWRTAESDGKPIDAKVDLTNAGALDGPVNGAVELARRMATANEVRTA